MAWSGLISCGISTRIKARPETVYYSAKSVEERFAGCRKERGSPLPGGNREACCRLQEGRDAVRCGAADLIAAATDAAGDSVIAGGRRGG